MSENNRQFPRREIQIEVQLNFLGRESRAVITRDMSDGGLFMRLHDTDTYLMGEMVNLRFKDPLDNFKETEKDGIIVRHTDDGMAVAYIEIDGF